LHKIHSQSSIVLLHYTAHYLSQQDAKHL
jgi:hypothetical protein